MSRCRSCAPASGCAPCCQYEDLHSQITWKAGRPTQSAQENEYEFIFYFVERVKPQTNLSKPNLNHSLREDIHDQELGNNRRRGERTAAFRCGRRAGAIAYRPGLLLFRAVCAR